MRHALSTPSYKISNATCLLERRQFLLRPQLPTRSQPVLARCAWTNVGVLYRIVGSILLITLFSGCASLGIRPDLPAFSLSPEAESGCKEKAGTYAEECLARIQFDTIVDWSNKLEESYRSRATFNEWSIYFAGAIALATVSTSAALAIVHTAQETLALVPVAGGFSGAFFGFLDNKSRAAAYTVAANEIANARAQAIDMVTRAQAAKATSSPTNSAQQSAVAATYHCQAGDLYKNVIEARNKLETTRKEQLAGTAQERLATEVKGLSQKLDEVSAQLALQNALITGITLQDNSEAKMTVINLQPALLGDLTVVVGNNSPVTPQSVTNDLANQQILIVFKPPAAPSPPDPKGYVVTLRVRGLTVRSLPEVRLIYKSS
jgi:hypothetical protein